jgi:hypothetical protein
MDKYIDMDGGANTDIDIHMYEIMNPDMDKGMETDTDIVTDMDIGMDMIMKNVQEHDD